MSDCGAPDLYFGCKHCDFQTKDGDEIYQHIKDCHPELIEKLKKV